MVSLNLVQHVERHLPMFHYARALHDGHGHSTLVDGVHFWDSFPTVCYVAPR